MAAIRRRAEKVSQFLACAKEAREQFHFPPDDRCGPWFRGHERGLVMKADIAFLINKTHNA